MLFPSSNIVALTQDAVVYFLDLNTNEIINSLIMEQEVDFKSMSISNCSKKLSIYDDKNDNHYIWSIQSLQQIVNTRISQKDQKNFQDLGATQNVNQQIKITNILSNENFFKYLFKDKIKNARLIKNDQILILQSEYSLKIFNVQDPSNLQQLGSYTHLEDFSWSNNENYLCYKPNSNIVITEIQPQKRAQFIQIEDKITNLFSLICGKRIFIETNHSYGVFDLNLNQYEDQNVKNISEKYIISFDNKLIAQSTESRSIILYDKVTKQQLFTIKNFEASHLQFSKDGNQLFAKFYYNQINIYSIDQQKKLIQHSSIGFRSDYTTISSLSQYLAISKEINIKLINLSQIQNSYQSIYYKDITGTILSRKNNRIILSRMGNQTRIDQLMIYEFQQHIIQVQNKNLHYYQGFIEIDNDWICVGYFQKILLININPLSDSQIVFGVLDNKVELLLYFSQKNLLATSERFNRITLWNFNLKKKIAVYEGHTQKIQQISFFPDGLTLASISQDCQIKLWNIQSNDQQNIYNAHQSCINKLVHSKDGLILASCSQVIILWDLIEKTQIIKLEQDNYEIICLDFSFCSQWLVSCTMFGQIWLWDVKIPKEAKLYFMTKISLDVDCINFSPVENNTIIISSQKENKRTTKSKKKKKKGIKEKEKKLSQLEILSINKIRNQEIKIKPYFKQKKEPFCFSSNDEFFIQGYNNLVRIHCLSTGQQQDLIGHKGIIKLVRCSRDSKTILSVDEENTIIIWNQQLYNWEISSQILYEPESYNKKIEFSPNNQEFASMNKYSIIITNLNQSQQNFKNLTQNVPNKVISIYLSNSQQRLVIQSQMNSCFEAIIMNTNSGNIEAKFDFENCQTSLMCMSNDDKLLAISFMEDTKIFEIQQQQEPIILNHSDRLLCMQFSEEDSNIFFTASFTGQIKKWNIKNLNYELKVQIHCESQQQLILTKKLNFIAVLKEQLLLQIIITKDQSKYQFNADYQINSFAFSNNELFIAFCTKDGKINLWNLQQNKLLDQFKLFSKEKAINLIFSQNDQQLICCQKQSINQFIIKDNRELQLIGYLIFQSCDFCVFCPDSQSIFLFYENGEKHFSLINKRQISILYDKQHYPLSFSYSQEGNLIASIDEKNLIIWDLKNASQFIKTNKWQGQAVLFISQSTLIIGCLNEIKMLEIAIGNQIKEIDQIQFDDRIMNLFLCAQSYNIVCYFESLVRIWKITANRFGQLIAVFSISINDFFPIISQNGNWIAQEGGGGVIRLNNMIQVKTKEFHNKSIQGFQYTFDYSHILTITDEKACLINMNNLDIVEIQTQLGNQIALDINASPVEPKIVTLYKDKLVISMIIETNKLIQVGQIDDSDIISMAISPLGNYLITSNLERTIKLTDFSNYKLLAVLKNQNDYILDLSFNPNELEFAAGFNDGSINLYSIESVNTQKVKQKNKKEQESLSEVNNEAEQLRLVCYKSFARQSLILADQCILKKAIINQYQKSIINLFIEKGAKK